MSQPRFPYPLQPLRVPGGWHITVNTLFEVEPGPDTMQWFSSALLLWGSCRDTGYCFNSHFEPEDDPAGEFVVEFCKVVFDRQCKKKMMSEVYLGEFRTKSRLELIKVIESYMLNGEIPKSS